MNTQTLLVIVTFLAAASLALAAGVPNANPAPAVTNSSPMVNQNAVVPSNHPSVQVPPPGPVKEGGAPDDLSADATWGLLGLGGYGYGRYGGWYGRGWGSPYYGGYYGRPYYGGWGGWGR